MIDELPRMAVKGRGAVGAPKHRFTTREQVAIDDGIAVGSVTALLVIVGVFVVIALIGWISGYWQSYLSSWVGERVLLDLRRQVFDHMMRLELGHHERTPTGRSVSRLTADIEAVNQLVVEGATSLSTASRHWRLQALVTSVF